MIYFKNIVYIFVLTILFKDVCCMEYPSNQNILRQNYHSSKNFMIRLEKILCNNDFEQAFYYIKQSEIKEKNIALQLLKKSTCSHIAAYFDLPHALKELYALNCFRETQESSFGLTPLHVACLKNKVRAARVILEHDKKSINMQDHEGQSSLHIISQNNNQEIIELLVEAQVDLNIVDRSGNTPLHICAENGYQKMVKYLLEKGARANIINKDNNCAFDKAMNFFHCDTALTLLYYNGCTTKLKTSSRFRKKGYPAENCIINIYKSFANKAMQQKLISAIILDKGKDFDKELCNRKAVTALTVQAKRGITPLMWAVCRDNCKVLEKMLAIIKKYNQSSSKKREYTARDILKCNCEGYNVLNIAHERKLIKIHKLLYNFLKPERERLEQIVRICTDKMQMSEDIYIFHDVFEHIMEYVHGPKSLLI